MWSSISSFAGYNNTAASVMEAAVHILICDL